MTAELRSTADLRELLDAVDWCYFDGHLEELDVSIGWMRRDAADVRVGEYCFEDRAIRLNRRLALPFVPRFYVMQVVFHEGLHAVHGPASEGQDEHGPAFHADEKRFALSFEVFQWERLNFDKLCAMPVPKGLR